MTFLDKLPKADMFAALARCYEPEPIVGLAQQIFTAPRFATPQEEAEMDASAAEYTADWPGAQSQKSP